MKNSHELARQAIHAYLLEHGDTTTAELRSLFGRDHTSVAFAHVMQYMKQLGIVENVRKHKNAPGVWAAVVASESEAEAHYLEQCLYPRYCPAVPPPRQHDTRQCTGWRPPAMACTRPGAADFLSLPSRVGEQRNPHQPGYIAALASDHNTPADA